MIENLARLKEEARSQISAAEEMADLERLRVKYLGKKGTVTTLLHQLRDLDPDKRREVGALVNETKTDLEIQIETKMGHLRRQTMETELKRLPPLDVTLPGQYSFQQGSLHPITQVITEATSILKKIGFSVASGPEIETEFYNFEALNTPESHPARDAQDTFYINPPILLRSHTSSVQIRTMQKCPPPIQIISVGRVYRSDHDSTHTPMFHQMEGLMVDTDISFADLKGILHYFVQELFGDRALRFRPSFFPFTEPSAEVDMEWKNSDGKTTWLEIGGCGMVHPNVYKAVDYDSESVSGFAFGMGIERIAMLKYGIPDLRSLFENDVRMLEQF